MCCAFQLPEYEAPVRREFQKVLTEALGRKTQHLSGTGDEVDAPIGKNRCNMKKLISINRSLRIPTLLNRSDSQLEQEITEETEEKRHEKAPLYCAKAEADYRRHASTQTPLRAFLKMRPVRGPGLQDGMLAGNSCRPRALTRRSGSISRHALSKLLAHFSISSVGSCASLRSAMIASFLFSQAVFAADFSVSSPGFFYAINGTQPNPTLTLVRGQTYTFAINTDLSHPFEILSPGVVNNNISQGTITYTVPTVASNYTYICSVHFFGAQIITVAASPPPPPTIRILSLAVSNNVVLRSTGTNGWSVNPEFSTNLSTTNWFAMSVLSNRFLNGINETFCGRPPGTNVFLRIRSQPN